MIPQEPQEQLARLASLGSLRTPKALSKADQAGHRRLRFSFFADEPTFHRACGSLARGGVSRRGAWLGRVLFGPVAQVVRAHP
jgi:hypothetical protein